MKTEKTVYLDASRYTSLDGRFRVPAKAVKAIGLSCGDKAYVVTANGTVEIHAQPPSDRPSRAFMVDQHYNILIRFGLENVGKLFDVYVSNGIVLVVPKSRAPERPDTDGNARTALMRAAREGRLDEMGRLLAEGASVNDQDHQGWTALHWAASHTGRGNCPKCCRQAEAVRLLLQHGANPEIEEGGHTALMMAAAIGDEATTRLLLEAGANPNVKNHEGRSAWDFAREEEALPVMFALKEFGAESRW